MKWGERIKIYGVFFRKKMDLSWNDSIHQQHECYVICDSKSRLLGVYIAREIELSRIAQNVFALAVMAQSVRSKIFRHALLEDIFWTIYSEMCCRLLLQCSLLLQVCSQLTGIWEAVLAISVTGNYNCHIGKDLSYKDLQHGAWMRHIVQTVLINYCFPVAHMIKTVLTDCGFLIAHICYMSFLFMMLSFLIAAKNTTKLIHHRISCWK